MSGKEITSKSEDETFVTGLLNKTDHSTDDVYETNSTGSLRDTETKRGGRESNIYDSPPGGDMSVTAGMLWKSTMS